MAGRGAAARPSLFTLLSGPHEGWETVAHCFCIHFPGEERKRGHLHREVCPHLPSQAWSLLSPSPGELLCTSGTWIPTHLVWGLCTPPLTPVPLPLVTLCTTPGRPPSGTPPL